MELGADLVLIDEMKARNRLKLLGQKVKGTLGILVEGYRKGFVGNLKLAIDSLKNKGFIDSPGEVDTYTFYGNAGDVVIIRMAEIDSHLEPKLSLYGKCSSLCHFGREVGFIKILG